MKKNKKGLNILFTIIMSIYFVFATTWDFENSNDLKTFFIKFSIVFVFY